MKEKDLLFEKQQFFLDRGIDIDARIVEVNDIDECSVHDVARAVRLFEKLSKKDPITVVVSSFGGDVYTGLRIYDVLKDCSCPIITIGEGKVMSMGTIVYLAGDKRYALPNTTFMFHEVSSLSLGKLSEIKNDLKEVTRLEGICLDIIAKNTSKNKKWWEKETKHVDKFFNYQESKKLGIITHERKGK
jgi:ATP-dependent Clp protease protease subunit